MSKITKPRASYGVAKKNIPGVQVRAQAMHDGISTTSALSASPISMVVFLALITDLATAQQVVASTRARGSATLRDTKRDAVWTAMGVLRAFVQQVADTLDAQNAAALIVKAGLLVAGTETHQKEILKAALTSTPGVVHLEANATALAGKPITSKKIQFHWQWSGDGKTWNDARPTVYADTDIEGLPLLSTVSFRVSVTIGKVASPWSAAVSLLVH